MMFVTGLLFLAITAGANTTLPNAFWAEFYGTRYLGAIKSLAAAIMVLGSALGPGITGVMIDWDIGLESQYIAVAIFFILSTVVMSFGVWRAAPHLPKSIVADSPSSL
jgi:MFS family permease